MALGDDSDQASFAPDARDAPAGGVRALARPSGRIRMLPETARAVAANEMKKGDVLGAARFAGRQGAKEAASYLPASGPEWVGRISIDFAVGEDAIDVTASVESESDLGARVRALSAVTVATLTIYDMCKSADRTMEIGPVAAIK